MSGEGTQALTLDLQVFLDERAAAMAEDESLLEQENETRAVIDAEARLHIERLREQVRARKEAADDDDDFNDDDFDIEVEYVR